MSLAALFESFAAVLLHFVWQGAAIGALLALALAAARGRGAATRHGLACAALLAMLFAPLLTAAWIGARAGATVATGPSGLAWIGLAWAVGVALLGLRLVGGGLLLRRLRARGRLAPPEVQVRFLRIARQLGIRRRVRLLVAAVDVPMAVGWLRPAVLLPASALTGLTPAQLDAILAHELAHVRRFDPLIAALQGIAETLLFFHPAVWWVSGLIRREREHAADDVAVGLVDALVYTRALADLEAGRGAALPAPAADGGSLLERIRRLLGDPPPPRRGWRAGALLALLLLIGAVVGVGAPAPARAEGQHPSRIVLSEVVVPFAIESGPFGTIAVAGAPAVAAAPAVAPAPAVAAAPAIAWTLPDIDVHTDVGPWIGARDGSWDRFWERTWGRTWDRTWEWDVGPELARLEASLQRAEAAAARELARAEAALARELARAEALLHDPDVRGRIVLRSPDGEVRRYEYRSGASGWLERSGRAVVRPFADVARTLERLGDLFIDTAARVQRRLGAPF